MYAYAHVTEVSLGLYVPPWAPAGFFSRVGHEGV